MINFRYHVVSLTAVFLALAIGLVVGTAALNGPLADNLSDRVNGLSNQNKQLRDQVGHYQEDANRQEKFAAEAAPYTLAGALTGRRVAIVSLPSANEYVDGIANMLTVAGAKVTSRIEIQDKFTDPANNVSLLDLAHDPTMPSITGLPRNSDGVETSSALLAAVLLDRPSTMEPLARTTVLAAYKKDGYLAINGQVTGPAEAVIVVCDVAYVDRDAAKKNAANLTLVSQFDEAGPIVLAGSGTAGTGNTIAEVRGDPALSKTVSTVDNAATTQGRIVTSLALAEQFRFVSSTTTTVKAGHYGIEPGATSLVPKRPQ